MPAASSLCIVYVSDGIRGNIIRQLKEVVNHGLIHSFQDITYNRTSFFLIGPNNVTDAINICKNAYSLIDFTSHSGTHPSLGVIDHVCFFPLGSMPMEKVVMQAKRFASEINSSENIPTYYYGEASPLSSCTNKIKLKDIRKSLGYFDSTFPNLKNCPYPPDLGPTAIDHSKGVMCVGTVPFVQNFNIRFQAGSKKKAVIEVTKFIREEYVRISLFYNFVHVYITTMYVIDRGINITT